jgi:membrane-bound lytic murein transglycosylase A
MMSALLIKKWTGLFMMGLRAPVLPRLILALALTGCTATSLEASVNMRPDVRATFRRSCEATPAEINAAAPRAPVMADLGAFNPDWRGRCIAGYLDNGRFKPFVQAPPPPPSQRPAIPPRRIDLLPATFADLPGWANDDKGRALAAFKTSCAVMARRPAGTPLGSAGTTAYGKYGTYGDWQPACRAAAAVPAGDAAATNEFFIQWFRPWQSTDNGNPVGLFTGYYELTLDGSRTRHGAYQTPLRALPHDMVTAQLGDFTSDLAGRSLNGRVDATGTRLVPYPDRAAINAGGLAPGEDRAIVWVKDDIKAFFLEIQGSGVVNLDDGTALSVNYAGGNGYPYHAIGAELVRRGIPREQVSMQSIYSWLVAHPAEKQAVMNTNRSYVFFRDRGPANETGPIGAQGVPLTPGRSLAVDRTLVPYGAPVWIDADSPTQNTGQATSRLQRLMIAQDTGGAIRGAVRGDYFWGRGDAAEDTAGVMKSPGRMWLLLPKTIQP